MLIERRKVLDHLLYCLSASSVGLVAYRMLKGNLVNLLKPSSSELKVRERPLAVRYVPLSSKLRCTDDELRTLEQAVLPDPTLARFPISWVYHALRVWGPNARFSQFAFLREELQGAWSAQMMRFLMDDAYYAAHCMENQSSLFAETEFGLMVRTVQDNSLESKWSSTHPGKYLHVMAELAIPAASPVCARGATYTHTIADIVRDDARRVHSSIEFEWTAVGLLRYLRTRQWVNRFGQSVSFNSMAQWLIDRPFGRGACFGCHVPFALACFHQLHQTEALLDEQTALRVQQRLREYSQCLDDVQDSEGGWSPHWYSRNQSPTSFLWGSREWDQVACTGHHLEWTALLPDSMRPAPKVLTRAIRHVARMIRQLRSDIRPRWRTYLPASHAVKAVLTLCGHEFGKWDRNWEAFNTR